jgi:hypothetical protein
MAKQFGRGFFATFGQVWWTPGEASIVLARNNSVTDTEVGSARARHSHRRRRGDGQAWVPSTIGRIVMGFELNVCTPTASANASTATGADIDLAAIKQRQQTTWASGDFAVIGTTLQIVGESLAEAGQSH